MRYIFCLFLVFSSYLTANAQLISEEAEKNWRAAIPAILHDEDVQNALKSDTILFYDEQSMPKAYQHNGGIHSPSYNIAAVRQFDSLGNRLPGNGNAEFPWDKPGGTDFCKNLVTLRFLYLPKSNNGVKWPVVYWYDNVFGEPIVQWIFPEGAILGEILAFKPANEYYAYVFQIRVRKRYADKYEMDVFQPFNTAKDLANALEKYDRHDLADKVLNKPQLVNYTLADNQKRQAVFRVKMPLDFLPEFNDPELVKKLLTETPFSSSTGMPWRWDTEGKTISNAPITKEDFSIVPKDYLGGMVTLTNESCTRCHSTTNHHVNEFTHNPRQGREWYGRIRGNDGIFSFHIFDPRAISYNGFTIAPVVNQTLVKTGYVAMYNPNIHVKEIYKVLPEYNPRNTPFRENNVAGLITVGGR